MARSAARVAVTIAAGAAGGAAPARAEPTADPFAENVRTAPPRSPEEQQRSFILPPGFAIELVAAEPTIAKPTNMAFDTRGRLWVSETREYPFPAPADRVPRDAVKVLEDRDGDGRFETVTTFADGLNIPIGILPYRDGVVVWSIPNIWFLRDTDSDGEADRREILYGPLGHDKDTHGNAASFRRGFDGWLYATHGFSNTSTLKGKDGSSLTIHSGNNFRVRLDGSRVEPWSFGQVNPFGTAFDPLGNLYSADCHSSPIYQLIRGAYYPSFGKPHDGLGFGPALMQHSHGSTAIAGLAMYSGGGWPPWPEEYRDNVFLGNVMTSRLNRDRMEWKAGSPRAVELPDLLRTEDSWFRPVDLQWGPDGALYIADFYNRIIGHYEVPLDHPGRDRERARIWRLVYRGADARHVGRAPTKNLASLPTRGLVAELGGAVAARRLLATHTLVDRGGREVVQAVRAALAAPARDDAAAWTVAHGLWVLQRLGALDGTTLVRAARHPAPAVRVHLQRTLAETRPWPEGGPHERLALAGTSDPNLQVVRAAADALGQHPSRAGAEALLTRLLGAPAGDEHLTHTLRVNLRAALEPAGILPAVAARHPGEAAQAVLGDIALGLHGPLGGAFLLGRLEQIPAGQPLPNAAIRHVARYAPTEGQAALARLATTRFAKELDAQLGIFAALEAGATQRGEDLVPEARVWGAALASASLASLEAADLTWQHTPIDGVPASPNPWRRQRHGGEVDLLSSAASERATGQLRSPDFTWPGNLTFHMAGHDGPVEQEPQRKNLVRLRRSAGDEILATASAPRADRPTTVTWRLPALAGARVYLEAVDAIASTGQGWLAVGGFSQGGPAFPALAPGLASERLRAATELARTLDLPELGPELTRRLALPGVDLDAKAAIARTLWGFGDTPDDLLGLLAPLLGDTILPVPLRLRLAALVGRTSKTDPRVTLLELARGAPLRAQARLAQALAQTPAGATLLLGDVERGAIPARVLLDEGVAERLAQAEAARMRERIAQLTARLPPENPELVAMLEGRRAGWKAATALPSEGHRVFSQTCAACHRLEGQGGLIGPQLDGIGNRGLDRLVEDILDPNRNVDHAFRAVYYTLGNDEVLCGLPRREEGEVLVVADLTGREHVLRKKDIKARRESDTSLMPDNFGELLSQDDFNHLLAFLLNNTGRSATPGKASPPSGGTRSSPGGGATRTQAP
jgi:putative heme-binding domain-containing protein